MAKIRNTAAKNIYGDGYEKEITLDNGSRPKNNKTTEPSPCLLNIGFI